MENKWKNQTFFQSLKNAINGIIYAIKTQRNIKIQLVFAVVVIILGIFLKLSNIEWAIIFLTIFCVILAELVNTAIEKIVDLCTEEYNEKAKIAKDVAAAGVTIMAIGSVIVGIILFLPKIIKFLNL